MARLVDRKSRSQSSLFRSVKVNGPIAGAANNDDGRGPEFWGHFRIEVYGSMRTFCLFGGLAASLLIASSAQARSRGFAWFFSHTRSHGNCAVGEFSTLADTRRRTAHFLLARRWRWRTRKTENPLSWW